MHEGVMTIGDFLGKLLGSDQRTEKGIIVAAPGRQGIALCPKLIRQELGTGR